MKSAEMIEALSALAQETRLKAFRILVAQGRQGMLAGTLSDKLDIPHNTLSFHLALLRTAGLIHSRKAGRTITYYTNLDAMQKLVSFLIKDCCAADKNTCADVEKLLRICAC